MQPIKNFLFGGAGATTRFGDIGLMILRVGAGAFLAYGFGWAKFYHDGSFGPNGEMVRGVANLGFPMPTVFAWMAVLTEFLGASLLALGLLTRPAALALTFNMAVAAFGAHAKDPFSAKEHALLYMVAFATFIFTGAGRYSLDKFFRKSAAAARA
jgi:putative oxidoreductase